MKPEGAAVTSLNRVFHLRGEDRHAAAVADLAGTGADNVIAPASGSMGSVPAASFCRIFSAAPGEDGISPLNVKD